MNVELMALQQEQGELRQRIDHLETLIQGPNFTNYGPAECGRLHRKLQLLRKLYCLVMEQISQREEEAA